MDTTLLEGLLLAMAGAAGVLLVGCGWWLAFARPYRLALVALGIGLILAIIGYVLIPLG
jgi:hypothetical protein